MLREAKRIAKEVDAEFIFTGDVLGERPMSQYKSALKLEETEAGLEGRVLRPLSAKLLPVTVPERNGWVDRNKLFAISGRSRKPQIELAQTFGLQDEYPTPAGGCRLTYKEFASKVRDLFEHTEKVTIREAMLLQIGRHFRVGTAKIIAYAFEVPGYGSPITILEGTTSKEAVEIAAKLTARYSDAEEKSVFVDYWVDKKESILVTPLDETEVVRLRI